MAGQDRVLQLGSTDAGWVTVKTEPRTLAERLGHPRDAKLLIVHADDLGMTHSINAAIITALETGLVNSSSLMAPCPWFPEAADYAKRHPEADFGVHLTLTSERVFYRWGPAASKDEVASLVDEHGYFHRDWTQAMSIDPQAAEIEIRAQIARARAFGVQPTHLDSHQYRLYRHGKPLVDVLLRIAREHELPVFMARDWFARWPYLEASLTKDDVVVDRTVTIEPDVPAEEWAVFYTDAVKSLAPGVTVFIIHPGYDDEEMRAFSRERATWGAAWRQRDFDYFTSDEFRRVLQKHSITLVTWREIGRLPRS